MHELSYMESMIDQIKDAMKHENFKSIKTIRLKIGKFSGIEPSCLDFCFESCSKGTIVEGATLNIDLVPLRVFCANCMEEYTLEEFSHICPVCFRPGLTIKSGQEIQLTDLEVD